jgi:hypothetical protein
MKLTSLNAAIDVTSAALRERGSLIRREHHHISATWRTPGANGRARQMDSCELMRLNNYFCFSSNPQGPVPSSIVLLASRHRLQSFFKGGDEYSETHPKKS